MKTMTRDFKLEGIGIPDIPIKPLINKEFVYDFEYRVNESYFETGMVVFKNEHIKTHRYTFKLGRKIKCPDNLKNVEYFRSINPFDKNDFTRIIPNQYGFDFAALLFKLGYCDGIISEAMYEYKKPYLFCIPITIVDPNKREEVRNFFNNLFKDDLKTLKIEDYGWGVRLGLRPINYGGKDVDEIKFTNCWDDSELFVTEQENEEYEYSEPEWDKRSHDERVAGITQDDYFNPLYDRDYMINGATIVRRECMFKNKKDADDLCEILKNGYNYYTKELMNVNPMNVKFLEQIIRKYN